MAETIIHETSLVLVDPYIEHYAKGRLQKTTLIIAKTSASLGPNPINWDTCISH